MIPLVAIGFRDHVQFAMEKPRAKESFHFRKEVPPSHFTMAPLVGSWLLDGRLSWYGHFSDRKSFLYLPPEAIVESFHAG